MVIAMLFFFTVLAVSVDAFIVSLAYGIHSKLKIGDILYASSFTFVLCAATLTVSSLLGAGRVLRLIGGLVFIVLGLKMSFAGRRGRRRSARGKSGGYRELAALGIGVGTDAALACLSLPDAGIGIAASAFFLFAAHFLFICCGMAAADAVRPLASGRKCCPGCFWWDWGCSGCSSNIYPAISIHCNILRDG